MKMPASPVAGIFSDLVLLLTGTSRCGMSAIVGVNVVTGTAPQVAAVDRFEQKVIVSPTPPRLRQLTESTKPHQLGPLVHAYHPPPLLALKWLSKRAAHAHYRPARLNVRFGAVHISKFQARLFP